MAEREESSGAPLPKMRLHLDAARVVSMEFVYIPAGSFWMGSPDHETNRDTDEKLHLETVGKEVWIATTELTQQQWATVMLTDRCSCGGVNKKSGPNLSMGNLHYGDARAFLDKLNANHRLKLGTLRASLPTEAEWEYSCRAGSRTRWCFGEDESRLGDYAWYDAQSQGEIQEVGTQNALAARRTSERSPRSS